ncbi:protein phosphatase 1 regulatory subunit 15B-like [Xyrauchen texanus]|uniref:protein phosphatase 1 regulatory subunit 15B-like n=1 Tax=Xyrauchen texanus TaxID=154827 RepID=UPI0022421E46|nr:protein phosphatase 1 regulatory subunit 15B-like [Xyrauchen texanus]
MERSGTERTALRRFGDSGMMLLPWTKQILCVVWDHLRLLVQIICCTFMTVFQMFRFEVHLRITNETGQHIQHMTSGSGDPSDSFLLSSLFETNKNMVVGSSGSLSKFARDPFDVSSHSRAVLSSLVNDELCCSLVDDFVSHATECLTDSEDLYIGDHSMWKHGYDWSVLGGSERKCGESRCSPVSFAACVSGFSAKEIGKPEKPINDPSSCRSSIEDVQGPGQLKSVGQFSDSEFSWGSTDSSCLEGERDESDRLWELLTSSSDPYHPLRFTACLSSAVTEKSKAEVVSQPVKKSESPTASQSTASTGSDSSKPGSEDEEEEALWRSLSQNHDPYHPLNFRATLQSSPATPTALKHCSGPPSQNMQSSAVRNLKSSRCTKPPVLQRNVARHCCHTFSVNTLSVVPWRRHAGQTAKRCNQSKCPTLKKVKFSPIVQVHKMQAWSFALHASRKGLWEELARDRDRFRKRISETEKAIGYCFSPQHREKLWAYKDSIQMK